VLLVLFLLALMTAVGVGSIALFMRDRGDDVELAREAGLELPGGGDPTGEPSEPSTVTPTGTPPVSPSAPALPGPGSGLDGGSASFVGGGVLFGVDVDADGDAPDGDGGAPGAPPGAPGGGPEGDPGPTPDDEGTPPGDDSGSGDTTGVPFAIAGSPAGPLSPGTSVPVNLAFSNPNDEAVTVTSLTVSVTATDRPDSCPAGPNFAVVQFTPPYSDLVLPAGPGTSLRSLGIDEARWPRVVMIETGRNQNACQGAVLTLTFTGTAEGDQR
jgi:hypothetical protein